MDDDQSRPSDPTPIGGEELDPATLEALQSALGDLDFLRPDTPLDEAPMPEWAWDRITAALDEERVTAPVARHWNRWIGGVVAASVAVLAVGVGVTTFSGSDGGEVLVAEAPATPAVLADPAPQAVEADPTDIAAEDSLALAAPPEEEEAAESGAGDDLSIPGMLSFAGMVPPAATVVGSRTDYSTPELTTQVADMLSEKGMGMPRMKPEAAQPAIERNVPLLPESAVQMASQSLRDCITRLTQLADSTALLVDWSQVDGQTAGVVVVPEYEGSGSSAPNVEELDVWVIDPECDVRMSVHMSMP